MFDDAVVVLEEGSGIFARGDVGAAAARLPLAAAVGSELSRHGRYLHVFRALHGAILAVMAVVVRAYIWQTSV
ncbi:hypothetical protein ABZ540_33875 [Nocardia xishanensis]|uniref:hypothetical protein n=1 Tax=Nocardia xishanensis TaxID=238964 RepID=UPI0033FD235A